MTLWIGTSGFQYAEWKGTFYPDPFPASKMLPYYAERFPTTEINYSFRRIPSIKSIANWAAATPEHFKFSFKAPQKVTHFAKLRDTGDTVTFFHSVISELGSRLGSVLFQLPPTLAKDLPLLESFLGTLPDGMRAAFEFRHASWFDDSVYEALRVRGAALCIAESEELATPAVATADFGYLRLRREDYSDADLTKWAGLIRANGKKWSETFIYFKHEATGTGPKFAAELRKLLGKG